MKFGRKINADSYDAWREDYLDYNRLKKILKQSTTDHHWTVQDEQDFVASLERELEKIYKFQRRKTQELAERIATAESIVQSLVAEYELSDSEDRTPHTFPLDDPEAFPGKDYDDSDEEEEGPGLSSDGASLEDQFRNLEEDVAVLVADVHDLALYTKLNFTGFIKIVKKHDKKTQLSLKTTFVQDFLDKRPFYKYNWDALIIKLSKLYNLVRTRGHPVEGDSSAGGSQNAFVRQTTKYWVHPDNLVHLKLSILRYLPVLVFNPHKEFEPKDAAITSIYFDNEDMDLYLGRLEKTEGAEAIRLRWYGDVNVKQIFVERKTHREDWTGEKSIKARFPIKEENVNEFLSGKYTMDKEFQALVQKGRKTTQEVENMKQLANEVQYAILSKRLVPVLRTFYHRTAFQLPGDARVRISLDTELTMVREDNWDGRIRAGGNWRRTDIGIDWPFNQLQVDDKENFPYGILEIKLQTQMGEQPPVWVTDLVNSHLVEAVPKFSKFIHGCATLLPNRVDLVPFWLPQMDVDIRKPDIGALHIERPLGSGSRPDSRYNSETASPANEKAHYTEPLSEGEEDEEIDLAIASEEDKRTGLPSAEVTDAIAFRHLQFQKQSEEGAVKRIPVAKAGLAHSATESQMTHEQESSYVLSRRPILSIDPLAPAATFDRALSSKLNGTAVSTQQSHVSAYDEPVMTREWRASRGKKMSVPVRIEPKVYFASERTFLMWMQFAAILGGIATTLLNFTTPEDVGGLVAAIVFTASALMSIAYSGIVFVYRSYKLRARHASGLYYDKYGPTILCFLLAAALAVNVAVRLL